MPSTIVPSSSKTFAIQPNGHIESPLVANFGRLHYKLDYDFSTNKVSIRFLWPKIEKNEARS